ncbi:hypothetical protein OH807_32695 [Kitasatospora sp. NBC_01560]|uniref:hypothetical protein n=1 Tax=Kitasatospora sp. NBC_01560 TaxID=2975965 RepID=UPI0038694508
MATNTATKALGVASVLVGFAAATVVIKNVVVGAGAECEAPPKSGLAPDTTDTGRICKPGEKDCKKA